MAKIIYAQLQSLNEKKNKNKENKKTNCYFCNYTEKQKLIIHVGNTAYIIAKKNPLSYGHLLVAPKRHITDITELNKDEDKDMMLLIKRAIKLLKISFSPESFEVIHKTKKDEHIYFQIIPKYNVIKEIDNPELMVKKLKLKNNMI